VLRLYETNEVYRVEADRKLATDASPCYLIYTAQITDPTQFDAGFTQVLIYEIAAHLAMVLSDNRSLASELRAESRNIMAEAKLRDAQESYPYKIHNKNSLRKSRRSFNPTDWWYN
jgi:hypothetical protein